MPQAPVELTGPTPTTQRIMTLDVLRGVALLGILVMNIRGFAAVSATYINPLAVGPMSPVDEVVWWLTSVLADQKFMTLFSLLFGAGVVLMAQRRDAAELPCAGLHYRRMGVLLFIGLVHALALWFGDILVTYALCGMLLYPLRRLGPKWLLWIGIGLLGVGALALLGFGGLMILLERVLSPEEMTELNAMMSPSAEEIAEEIAAYRGNFLEQMPARIWMTLDVWFFFPIWGVWRVCGLMLIGAALMKWGVLSGAASAGVYRKLLISGLGIGLPLCLLGVVWSPPGGRDALSDLFIDGLWNYVGSVPLALGYLALVVMLCRSSGAWTRPLAAAGRMSLTNYLMQSVICTLLFYGTINPYPLFGRLGFAMQLLVVIAVWVVQLGWSVWWLKRFRMGPMEALWRWASYGKRPALRL